MNRGSTDMNRGSTGDDRDEPGTTGDNRGSTGKVLKCLIPPGVTGKDREQPGRYRSSTGAHTDRGRATATPRLSHVLLQWRPGECRQSPGIATVHR
ncbi:hypothetical protein DPMN_093456 [Dreissena polymorpha]|uniref:Uncharacterized protein n=1 Tax=Dreissena polymorpha TaxID=45954 RepID=A0A9D4R2K1_DREPO|nr:hypothetical protein DPMN_093456 [Dreissena polymorpha]